MQICQIKDTLKINTLPKHLKIEIQYIQKVYRINWYDSAIIPETQTNITNYTISKMQWEYTKGGEVTTTPKLESCLPKSPLHIHHWRKET